MPATPRTFAVTNLFRLQAMVGHVAREHIHGLGPGDDESHATRANLLEIGQPTIEAHARRAVGAIAFHHEHDGLLRCREIDR